MPTKRRYTKREKLATVVAAEMTGLTATAESTGIPKSTLAYWMDDPEFVQVRTKTRDDLSAEIKTVAHLAWKRIAQSLASGEMEPRDAIFAAEKATTLQLLMSGEATARTENVSITDGLDDHEKDALREAILGELARRSDERAAVPAVGDTGSEGSDPA